MALLTFLSTTPPTTLLPTAVVLALISLAIYRLILHPLARIPGPVSCGLSSFWTYVHSYIGDEATLITAFHAKYGPVIRVAPNEVCISDGSCLAPIYSDKGGFSKAECYRNFNIDGFSSLFSELDRDVRGPKAKSVVPLFSTASLRNGEQILEGCVEGLVQRIRSEKEKAGSGGTVNVLNLNRSLALDAVTGYLFGKSYGGLEEDVDVEKEKKALPAKGEEHGPKISMSANEFVDAFVGVGRFFYLPNWIFVAVELLSEKFFGTKETEESMSKVDSFVRGVITQARPDDGSFPGRMLKAGLTPDEVAAQCKDLMFAGTDSSGMNLSTLFWQLAKNPEVYAKLKAEITNASTTTPPADPTTLPYLRACIRETLRLSMANPTRLPRVVPQAGWTYTSPSNNQTYYFPPGTLVSVQIHTLHLNPTVFTDPWTFNPDRWDESVTPKQQLDVMLRDLIPFGQGSRQCIARNLAMMELALAGRGVVASGVLEGAKAVGYQVEIVEWFNSKVKGEEILLSWA